MSSSLPDAASVTRLLDGYHPLGHVPDELLDSDGQVRPVWRQFIDHFASLPAQDIAERFALGDQYLRDAGVFFRQSDGPVSRVRSWPLSHVPVLIGDREWQQIEAGLVQRADLLETVVSDLYGENRLVAEGRLPAELVAQNPEWIRQMVGVKPRNGHYLHFIAFELGRSPDGQWWVLNDRTQAPAGAGFALENRVATKRIYSDLYAKANVLRLSGFFRVFRDRLLQLRPDGHGNVAILTPGTHTTTYYEHVYIARYLGLMLVEGEDIVIERGQPMVRTVSGSQPVSVLWRRVDAQFADPLELKESSLIGVPGLVGAVRQQSVDLVNALGSGVLETRALLAFLPRICEQLRGEPLKLPNIATWWCGQQSELDYVRNNVERMMVSPALSTRMPFDPHDTTVIGGQLRDKSFNSITDLLDRGASHLVAQEAVTLSTSPAFVDGALAPRPMSIRVFMARTENGWIAMPGGYARVGRSRDSTAVGMQQGGQIADVWVIADRNVSPAVSLIPEASAAASRVAPTELPSRTADNLFWLGRYIERAECLLRLKRAYELRPSENARGETPLLRYVSEYLDAMGIDATIFLPPELKGVITSATGCASRVRDRLSPDGWSAVDELNRAVRAAPELRPGVGAANQLNTLLRYITGFTGLLHENMYRNLGWRFLTIGRDLERAMSTVSMLASFTDEEAPTGALEVALECADSAIAYRRLYAFALTRETVLEFLGFEAENPRSLRFVLNEILEHVKALPTPEVPGRLSKPYSRMLRLSTDFALQEPATLTSEELYRMRDELGGISDVLSGTYMS
jgi:uncharacterized circularly permuted ATP-grasp superfamily protein/uncharacterized alpha-E superfamily protein